MGGNMLGLRVTFYYWLVPDMSPLLGYEMRLTQREPTVVLAMFTACIATMENIRCCGMNMSTFMFELIWGNWHNAREATGFLDELEGNACYKSATGC